MPSLQTSDENRVAMSLLSSRTPGLTPVALILVTYSQHLRSSSSIRNSLWLRLSPSQPLFSRSALLYGYGVRHKPRQGAASKGQRPAACAMPPKLFAQRVRMHWLAIHLFPVVLHSVLSGRWRATKEQVRSAVSKENSKHEQYFRQ